MLAEGMNYNSRHEAKESCCRFRRCSGRRDGRRRRARYGSKGARMKPAVKAFFV
jgi:hypothetical protein